MAKCCFCPPALILPSGNSWPVLALEIAPSFILSPVLFSSVRYAGSCMGGGPLCSREPPSGATGLCSVTAPAGPVSGAGPVFALARSEWSSEFLYTEANTGETGGWWDRGGERVLMTLLETINYPQLSSLVPQMVKNLPAMWETWV